MLERLRTGGYTHTLEPGVYGQHTADEFWFDRREGFCEHIAPAFVVPMRVWRAGAHRHRLPWRRTQQRDGFWTLRQSDAHAWGRGLAGDGWVRVDRPRPWRPGALAPSNGCAGAAGAVAAALAWWSAHTSAAFARRAGRRQQQLEPVGAELHASSSTC